MIGAGILIVWAGYGVSSWGYCLVKGYDITFRQWMTPLHPYTFPKGEVPKIPATRIWPGGSAGRTLAAKKRRGAVDHPA